MSNKMIFISHASKDTKLAESFVNLLEKSFDNIDRARIRCTSVEGYKLSIGDTPRDKLASELRESLIICLLTPRSAESPWVLFELGAAWGLSRSVLPVLNGLTYDELPGALKGTIAAQASNTDNVLAVIDEIESKLGWKKSTLPRIRTAAEQLSKLAATLPRHSPERLLFRSDIVKELPWRDVASQTKQELLIWAWSGLAAVNARTRSTLKSLLKDGRTVKFMIMNQASVNEASTSIHFGPVCSWKSELIKKDIADGRAELIALRSSLTPSEHERFIIKETSWFMAWSGLAIDPRLETGVLQIESYLYNYADVNANHLDFRPNMLLTADSRFYAPYWHSINSKWEAADRIV